VLRRSLILLTVLVVAGAGFAACGGGDDDPARSGSGSGAGSGTGGSGAADANLVGTQWVLDQAASGITPAAAATATAQFSSDGSLTGNGGCNGFNTRYRTDGSSLDIDPPLTTLMGCERAVMRVEQSYLQRLPNARSYAIDGTRLTITTRGGDPLVYDALDPEKAVAGDWEVTGYFRPGAIVSPVPGSRLTATFEDGRISGESGCNSYTGPFEVDDTKIAIGPLASTLRACADPAVGEQESQFLAALELARTFTVTGDNLTLLREDGGIAVTFARA